MAPGVVEQLAADFALPHAASLDEARAHGREPVPGLPQRPEAV